MVHILMQQSAPEETTLLFVMKRTLVTPPWCALSSITRLLGPPCSCVYVCMYVCIHARNLGVASRA